jgi:NTP pyrophosphatase (non-canonical NTP hydrolase)
MAEIENINLSIEEISNLATDWSKRNFGEHYGTGYRNLLGLSEEVGELCHAHLKGEQNIRHTPEEIIKMKKDAVGDILVFLSNYVDSQGFTLNECANLAWQEIQNRDWKKNNLTGATP